MAGERELKARVPPTISLSLSSQPKQSHTHMNAFSLPHTLSGTVLHTPTCSGTVVLSLSLCLYLDLNYLKLVNRCVCLYFFLAFAFGLL